RRHTRFSRDWSSDVCSSDLPSSFMIIPSETILGKWGVASLQSISKKYLYEVKLCTKISIGHPKAVNDSLYEFCKLLSKITISRRSEEHTSELQSREKLVCRL